MTPGDFEQNLTKAISDNPGVSPYNAGTVLLALQKKHPGPVRRLLLRRMESHAAAHIGHDPNTPRDAAGAVDWSKINWSLWLSILLKVLVALLPLLL